MALNILVIDDSVAMRSMIIKTLRLSGLSLGELYQASDGEKGLKVLESNRIDLALVDLNMPHMNGEEMIQRTKQNTATANIPILVVLTESSETRY